VGAHVVGAGGSRKDIATELVISVRTVEHHRATIYARTDARDRAGLIADAAAALHSHPH